MNFTATNKVPIKRFEVIELSIPAGNTLTTINFPDMSNLRQAKILSIDWYASDNYEVSPNTFSTLLPAADAKQCFITLYEGDLQRVKNLPLPKLNSDNNAQVDKVNGAGIQQPFDGIIISWTKSFVRFAATPTANCVIALGVTYLQPEDAGY